MSIMQYSSARTQTQTSQASIAKVFTPPKVGRNRIRKRYQSLSLHSQGIKAAWFLSGIRDSNCAFFHASLYPVFPALRLRIEAYLGKHQELANRWGQFAVTHILDEIVFIAFQRRNTWTAKMPVVDWLAGFIESASGSGLLPDPVHADDLISAHDESLYAHRVLAAGALGFINKRRAPEKLVDGIQAILRGNFFSARRSRKR